MKCPVCKDTALQSTSLEEHLAASSCSTCAGKWLSSSDYWSWLEKHGDTLPEKPPEGTPIEAFDRQRAKLCPQCQRIMLRYKVGHDLAFLLDQCGNCNGIWFDKNEWEALKQRNLHDEVHLVFSAPWQAAIRKEEARKLLMSIYAESFQNDYEKIKQLKTWIENHPEKEKILHYLSDADPYSIGSS